MVESRELTNQAINRLVARKQPAVICIDGPAGAGKTTFAARLHEEYSNVNVVHMDDLYAGWLSPINQEFSNRIIQQIVMPHKSGLPIAFKKYDWKLGDFNETQNLAPQQLLILEGVGSANRELRNFADLVIFIEIDADFGISRVLKRDGEQISTQMENWKSMQDAYFKNEDVKRAADIVFDGSSN